MFWVVNKGLPVHCRREFSLPMFSSSMKKKKTFKENATRWQTSKVGYVRQSRKASPDKFCIDASASLVPTLIWYGTYLVDTYGT
jgi:hypothetical protein